MGKKLKKWTIAPYLFAELIEIIEEEDALEIALSKVKTKRIFKYLIKRIKKNRKQKKIWWDTIRIVGHFRKDKTLRYDINLKEVREIEDIKKVNN